MQRITSSKLPVILILLTIAASLPATVRGRGGEARVQIEPALACGRAAIGGNDALGSVVGIYARGTFKKTRTSGAFELWIQLPDRFLLVEQVSQIGMNFITKEGLNGDRVILGMHNTAGSTLTQSAAPDDRDLKRRRATMMRYVWGLLLRSSSDGTRIASQGVAVAPEGRAFIVVATTADGADSSLFLEESSCRPLMMRYALERTISGLSLSDNSATMRPRRETIEVTEYFSDYRSVDRVLLPHKIARAWSGETAEEWEVERFELNPRQLPPELHRQESR